MSGAGELLDIVQITGRGDSLAGMTAEPAPYTIRRDGHLGATALSAFPPSLTAEHQTVLVGPLDRSALFGVLAQIEMLGPHLVELTRSDR
jgi:hypothetical protein